MAEVKNHWSRDPAKRADVLSKMSRGMKQAWQQSSALKTRENEAKKTEVRRQISKAVAQSWEDGLYDGRVNGMLGLIAAKHPNWQGGKRQYNQIAAATHGQKCFVADCQYAQTKIDVHHVDENRNNFLLTNLVPLCVPHHLWSNHYERKKAPFVTLCKRYEFEAAHVLPWHKGKCRRPHGHTYKFNIWVERRLDENGIAIDFGDISDIVRREIIDRYDHQNLNDYFSNPTAELILLSFWETLSAPLKGITRAELWETSTSFAELTREALLRSYWWTREAGAWKFVRRAKR